MRVHKTEASNPRGRAVGAEPSETATCVDPILPPESACEDPACAVHGGPIRSALGLPPPPDDCAAVLVSDLRAQLLDGDDAIARSLTVRANVLEASAEISSETAHALLAGRMLGTPEDAQHHIGEAARALDEAVVLRRVCSDLIRALAFLGIAALIMIAIPGCFAAGDVVTREEACELYDAEIEGAACAVACPHATATGLCDVARVHACAEAIRAHGDVCETVVLDTAAECDDACGVGR